MDDLANPQALDNTTPGLPDTETDSVPPPEPVVLPVPPMPSVPPVPPVPPIPPVPPVAPVSPLADTPAVPPPAAPPSVPFEKADSRLLEEIAEFRTDSEKRYSFNNFWDIVLSVAGMVLSIVVVWAGFHDDPKELIAILGALVGAVVTAQRAFPFGQRAGFYRLLIGQIRNLNTRATQGTLGKVEVINVLSSLRMDFAQQLPRGSSGPAPAPPATPTTAPAPTDPPPTDDDGPPQPA